VSGSTTPAATRPDASNTGVPAGTSLTTETADPYRITQAGAVISGRNFTGKVEVAAPNVTIRNSQFRDDGWWQVHSQSTGLVIEDSEFLGVVPCHNSIGYGGFTLRRVEITRCEHGADVGQGSVLIEDSWIHDLETQITHPDSPFTSPHTDGILGIGDNVTVRRNTIDPCADGEGGCTSGIIMVTTRNVQNYRIENNYIDGRGAAWAVYGPRATTTGTALVGNRMRTGNNGTHVGCGRNFTELAGNVDDVTGAPVSVDNNGGCTW
jgi:hypothetical protein